MDTSSIHGISVYGDGDVRVALNCMYLRPSRDAGILPPFETLVHDAASPRSDWSPALSSTLISAPTEYTHEAYVRRRGPPLF
jgi:hypothetical protein